MSRLQTEILARQSNTQGLSTHFLSYWKRKTPHWQREELNQVIWKFFADHTSHRIQVFMEHDMTDGFWDYQQIDLDISIEEYLKDWRGLCP